MEWFNCEVDNRSKVVGGAQRSETLDGYVFQLSIESGLVYMYSIWIPTDDDLQQYPHVFFTSPDIWDAFVLDRGITPALLEEFTKMLMILCSSILCLINVGIFTSVWYSTWIFLGFKSYKDLGAYISCPSPPDESC